ncbi:MAG: alpha/beta hydrolase [Alphaproteobacteria bacterium]|nr:alpha/beta hydrolase [Alphaproteobacteria bacterium]
MFPLLALSAFASKYHTMPAMSPEELYTPLDRQMLDLDGLQIAYVDSGGDKPPLLFIHGLSSYMGFWEYQLQEFTSTHRVIALDLPGYGSSSRPDAPMTPPWYAETVAGFMDALELDSAAVVGHSMGGQIAITLTLDHPERVDRLVLSAPAGLERFNPGAARWMKDWWHEGRAMHSGESEVRTAFLAAVFNTHDEGVERLIEERVRLGKHEAFKGTSVAVSRSIAGMVDHPVADRLGEIDVPTLIVFGTDDHMIPNPIFTGGRTKRIAEQGRDAIPGARLVLVPGAGHTVHHDAPGEFNRAVAEFLAGAGE